MTSDRFDVVFGVVALSSFPKKERTSTVAAFERKIRSNNFALAESKLKFTHLVVYAPVRTLKVLYALCAGLPVLDQDWLKESFESGNPLDLTDNGMAKHLMKRWKRNYRAVQDMKDTADSKRVLDGYVVHVLGRTHPNPIYLAHLIPRWKARGTSCMLFDSH